jgi:hypothetical protein
MQVRGQSVSQLRLQQRHQQNATILWRIGHGELAFQATTAPQHGVDVGRAVAGGHQAAGNLIGPLVLCILLGIQPPPQVLLDNYLWYVIHRAHLIRVGTILMAEISARKLTCFSF